MRKINILENGLIQIQLIERRLTNILIIIGKTCSGKDTILKKIIEDHGYDSITTYTTRPMRPGEVEGVNYHYITTEDFLLKEANGFFAETTSYNVVSGETWYYGSAIEDYDKDKVMIVNPDGIKQVSKVQSLNPVVFYIQAEEDVIRRRLSRRGDNPSEAERRMMADDRDFFGIDKYVNYSASNNGAFSPGTMADEIVKLYKNHNKNLKEE